MIVRNLLTLAFFLVVVQPAGAGDLLLTDQEGDTVRLKETPCPVEVLRHIPQGNRGYYQEAVVTVGATTYKACHALVTIKTGPGLHVHVVTERGLGDTWPAAAFVEQPDGI